MSQQSVNQQPQTVEEVREPEPEDYETNAQFIEAKVKHQVDKQISDYDSKRLAKQVEAESVKEKENLQTSYKAKAQEAVKKYPDFVETVSGMKLDVKTESLELIMGSEFGPDIAYHLAKNPEEAEKLSKASGIQGARMIGRLESKFETKTATVPKRKKTNAPDPIKGIKAKSNTSSKDPGKMTMKEYAAWRNAKK